MVTKLTDNRTLRQQYDQLMDDIRCCDNMIDPSILEEDVEPDLVEQQLELQGEMAEMCIELDQLDQVMNLKHHVDCDCFYTKSHPGHIDHKAWLEEVF